MTEAVSEEEMQQMLLALQASVDPFPDDIQMPLVSDLQRGNSGDVCATEMAVLPRSWKFLRFADQALDSYVAGVQNTEGRWMLGLHEIDMRTRGFGIGELAMVTGRPHAGKGQVVLSGLLNNLDQPQIFFTFDEPQELVFAKLAAMRLGLNAEWLEERVRANNPEVLAMLRELATTEFRNLVLIDDPINLASMSKAIDEARQHFGRPPAVAVIDYLELLIASADDVPGKAQELKRWVKTTACPVVCIHQAGRGRAADGKELTMEAMRFGGESEATFILGVERARNLPEDERPIEGTDRWNSVTVSVLKNKRPPGRLGRHDYYMHPDNGYICPFDKKDTLQPLRGSTVADRLS